MNAVFYNSFFSGVLQGDFDFLTDDIRVALLDSTYVFDGNGDLTFNNVISSEVTGTGYTSLGQSLDNKQLIVDTVDSLVAYDADDVEWVDSTITARFAVIYKYSGDPTTSPLLFLIDFDEDKTSGAGSFTIQWTSDGIVTFA